jgi:hypothetical protein
MVIGTPAGNGTLLKLLLIVSLTLASSGILISPSGRKAEQPASVVNASASIVSLNAFIIDP